MGGLAHSPGIALFVRCPQEDRLRRRIRWQQPMAAITLPGKRSFPARNGLIEMPRIADNRVSDLRDNTGFDHLTFRSLSSVKCSKVW